MSNTDKTEKLERKPDAVAPEKPKAEELTDKSLEQISGGIGGQIAANKVKIDSIAHVTDAFVKT